MLLEYQVLSEKFGRIVINDEAKSKEIKPFEVESMIARRAWESNMFYAEPKIHFTDFWSLNGDASFRLLVDIPSLVFKVYPVISHLYRLRPISC